MYIFFSVPGAEKSLAGIPISSFSYIDLVEGYIKYIQITHRDVEPEKDTVHIRISDGYLSSPAHLVNITIKPTNDEAPVLATHHISLLHGSFAKISNLSLSVSDGDTPANQLFIQVIQPPKRGNFSYVLWSLLFFTAQHKLFADSWIVFNNNFPWIMLLQVLNHFL